MSSWDPLWDFYEPIELTSPLIAATSCPSEERRSSRARIVRHDNLESSKRTLASAFWLRRSSCCHANVCVFTAIGERQFKDIISAATAMAARASTSDDELDANEHLDAAAALRADRSHDPSSTGAVGASASEDSDGGVN
jgi:hypothetical protein